MLSKKNLAICNHKVGKLMAKGMINMGKILTDYNLVDSLTESLPTDQSRTL